MSNSTHPGRLFAELVAYKACPCPDGSPENPDEDQETPNHAFHRGGSSSFSLASLSLNALGCLPDSGLYGTIQVDERSPTSGGCCDFPASKREVVAISPPDNAIPPDLVMAHWRKSWRPGPTWQWHGSESARASRREERLALRSQLPNTATRSYFRKG